MKWGIHMAALGLVVSGTVGVTMPPAVLGADPEPSAEEAARVADARRGEGAPNWTEDEALNRRVLIEGGEFLMGSPEGVGEDDEHPRHPVQLAPFYIQEHEVTNEEYRRHKPVHEFPQGEEKHPVVNVSWDDASAYAKWLGGRLPTEADWEYACRAGSESAYWSGDSEDDLTGVAWSSENSGGHAHPVGEKPANPWGLHDVHGNVWEWVADWLGEYSGEPQEDPRGPSSGMGRVIRGGSFWDDAGSARSAFRDRLDPRILLLNLGFRVAFPAAPSNGD